jgi:integrase
MTKRGTKVRHRGVTQVEGGYVVRVTHLVDGKQKEAQRKLIGVEVGDAVIEREKLRKTLLEPKGQSGEGETVGQFSDRWLRHLEITGRNRPHVLTQKRNTLDRLILPFFGELQIQKIQQSDLAVWMEWLSVQTKPNGQQFCQDTLANAWRILKTMLSDAVVLANAKEKPHVGVRFKVVGAKAREKASLTREELDAILAETAYESPDIALMIWVLGTTGLRFSEVSALAWSEVDVVKGVFRIIRSQVEKVVGETKTKRARVVPIHPYVRELLIRHWDEQKQDKVRGVTGLVFPSRVGTFRHPSCLTKPLKACAQRAGIDKRISSHVFRHSVNNLIRKTAGSVVAKAMLGHVTDAMHERYSSVSVEEVALAQTQSLGLPSGPAEKNSQRKPQK